MSFKPNFAATLIIGLFAGSSLLAQITCGTPADQAAITDCALNSKSADEADQCWANVIAEIDNETQRTFDALELMIRGLEPATQDAYDRRLKTIETGQAAFFDARGKICAIEAIRLSEFGACCQARMTRQMMKDFEANMNWH